VLTLLLECFPQLGKRQQLFALQQLGQPQILADFILVARVVGVRMYFVVEFHVECAFGLVLLDRFLLSLERFLQQSSRKFVCAAQRFEKSHSCILLLQMCKKLVIIELLNSWVGIVFVEVIAVLCVFLVDDIKVC